jgi:hypothetical protein
MCVGVVYELTYTTEHTSSETFTSETQSADGERRGDVGEARGFPNLAAPAVSAQKANKVPLGCSRIETENQGNRA